MDFHILLSFVVLNRFISFTLSFCLLGSCSASHLLRFVRYFSLCHPLLLFPSTLPVRINSSNPFFLIMCSRKSSCLFLMIINNAHLSSALLKTSSFNIRCVHDIFSILQQNISTACSLCSICEDIVQLSLMFVRIGFT